MIDVDRILRLLDVEAESHFVQAEAIDAINYLLRENARLQEENDAWRMDGGSCAEEVKRLREENARLRKALEPFAARLDDLEKSPLTKYACATLVEIEHLRAARAAIHEGEKNEN